MLVNETIVLNEENILSNDTKVSTFITAEKPDLSGFSYYQAFRIIRLARIFWLAFFL